MAELPIEQIADLAEVETLRKVNAELVAKRARDKARITELETGAVTLQSQLTEASESLHQVTIGGPLKSMAESMSNVPDLFLEQFSKHFKVEMVKGSLTVLSADGTPAVGKDKKPVPFERQALTDLLTTGDDARAKTFKAITFASRASGGASIGTHNRASQTKVDKPQFGLR
jgi:hypothetical protein